MRKVERIITIVAIGAIMVLGFQNCSSENVAGQQPSASSDPGAVDPAIFQALQNEALAILATRCANNVCNLAGFPPFTPASVADMRTNGYVVAGQPQNSPLYLAILDGVIPAGYDMVGQAPTEVFKLRDWIQALR